MAGYIVLGLGFGVLLQSKGYGAGWALAMGGLIYAGSMQYVTIDLLAGGASLISAALMTLMVNARHLFYGISMLERYKNTGAAKPYLTRADTFSGCRCWISFTGLWAAWRGRCWAACFPLIPPASIFP